MACSRPCLLRYIWRSLYFRHDDNARPSLFLCLPPYAKRPKPSVRVQLATILEGMAIGQHVDWV